MTDQTAESLILAAIAAIVFTAALWLTVRIAPSPGSSPPVPTETPIGRRRIEIDPMSLLSSQTPNREYATRPADERYPSVAALVAAALQDKELSAERTYNLKDLRAVATAGNSNSNSEHPNTIRLESPKGRAKFTHWSFGQLCRMLHAPADYLRSLAPTLAADCLNYGLTNSPAGSSASLLVKAPNGNPEPIIRAATSESYGRVWDATLYDAIQKTIVDRPGQHGNWTLPPTWSGEPAGAYRGDRDSFLVLANGGSIVEDPSLTGSTMITPGEDTKDGNAAMYRGILVRNSEVGASSVTIETILYRYICGNHMLWGAVMDKSFKRRHIGSNALRDTVNEINRIAYNWTNAAASRDEAIIKLLIQHEIAHTKEAVIDELRALGASKDQAERSYDLAEQKEAASPRSFWGVAQGLTRASQETEHQDTRYLLDKIAGLALAKGARLVRV